MAENPEIIVTQESNNDLNGICPPCKLLLNGNGAVAKLQLFQNAINDLDDAGIQLTPEATQKAIGVICQFDRDMDEVLKLLETSVERVE